MKAAASAPPLEAAGEQEPAKTAREPREPVVAFPGSPAGMARQEGIIHVAYSAILRGLPKELHGKITPPSSAKFSMAMDAVMEQLPRGAVKVNFGELRRSAPVGVFKAGSDQDVREIDLPLKEILPQLRPETFSRRPQQRVQVADEITDLFGRKGELLARLRVLDRNEIPKPPPAVSKPATPGTETIAKAGALPYPMPAPAKPAPKPATPTAPSKPATGLGGLTGSAAMPAVSASNTAPPPPPPQKTAPAAMPVPTFVAPAFVAPAFAGMSEAVIVPLSEFSKFWPEAINREIVQLGLGDAQCHLLLAQIGRSVKNGMVQLPWKQVRAWIQPVPVKGWPANTAETLLEIPLKVVASLTLTHGQIAAPSAKAPKAEPPADAPLKISSASLPNPTEFNPPAATEKSVAAKPKASEKPASKAAKASEQPAPESAGSIRGTGLTVHITLASVIMGWPAALRKELSGGQFQDAVLEIPKEKVEPGLKSGKLDFAWSELRAWLKPAAEDIAEMLSDVRLELPLPVVVPLLFQGTPLAKRASAADNIPDVFNVSGQNKAAAAAETPPTAVEPPPAETPAPVPLEDTGKKQPKDLAELFGEPEKRNWTPNEIVHKTTLLPNVCGALIALQDGLLVASCMPPNWKTETIAAFLPQIFGRMNQYAKELKMGDLNSVSFTVEQGTLQIYNAGIIYFAALGQPGVTLPTSLDLIARELSRHTR